MIFFQLSMHRLTQLFSLLFLSIFLPSLQGDVNQLASDKNDAADAMLAQADLPDAYAEELMAELDAAEESMVWKNYILQKLDVLYLHPDVADEMRPVILARLWKESRSPTTTYAGTALLTLMRLHEKRPDIVSSKRLSDHCIWVIDRPTYSNSDRLSALHVLSSIDQREAAAIARLWLSDDESAPMLQLTALAVLGQQPTAEDIILIRPYADHPDLRLRTAATKALAGQ